MNAAGRQSLWQRLTEAGLVQGGLPETAERSTPWFIRVMLGVAGWIGAIFLLAFVGGAMAFVFRSESAAIFVGGGCCAAAFAIFHVGGRNDLVAQFGLALSMAGQILLAFGLYESTNGGATFYLGFAIVEAILAAALNNFVNRVCCTFIAGLMLTYALTHLGIWGVTPGLVAFALSILWRSESSWAAAGSMWRAIGYGLALLLVVPDFATVLGRLGSLGYSVAPVMWIFWMKPVLVGAALVYTVHELLASERVHPGTTAWNGAMAAAGGLAIATYRTTDISSSLLLMLLGFARGNRALLGMGVAAMLWHLSEFYYYLQMTLLWKSFALGVTGLILLLLWALTRRLFGTVDDEPQARESAHA